MAQRRFHYEQAFEHYLRANRAPYVAVDEAKKTLLPAQDTDDAGTARTLRSLKSFDFVVYGPDRNLLVDVKGRMFGSRAGAKTGMTLSNRRFENWVTRDDVDSLTQWQELFGQEFHAVFVFLYCLRQQPPDALFEEVFEFGNRWYALRESSLEAYREAMVPRSEKWDTVHVPKDVFRRISSPFSVRGGCRPSGAAIC